jgi:nucleoside-diphosphate-sugar epimerase
MAAALQADGWDVIGVDIVGDSGVDCREVFNSYDRFELIVHCAAVVGGRATIDGSPLATAVNLALDAEMFRYAARTETNQVIYFSSSAAYPVALQGAYGAHVLREDDINLAEIALPDAVYGWAKLTGEMLAGHARKRGVSVSVLRPFSGYGEDQSTDYPFPSFVDRAARGVDPFEIWGSGAQVRDWVHIDDIVQTALAMIAEGHPGPLNVGWGEPVSFIELAARMCAQAGYSPNLHTRPELPTGVAYRVADVTELNRLRPPTIGLDEGIRRSLRLACPAVN